jgi:hypothetical protein
MRYNAKPYGQGIESGTWFVVPHPRYDPGVYLVSYSYQLERVPRR